MPTNAVDRGGKGKREPDLARLAEILKSLPPGVQAFVERVGPMPKQGVSSGFAFGLGYGAILGGLAALGLPCTRVAPAVWTKAMALGKGADAGLARASELLPAQVHHWTPVREVRTKEQCRGIADALLIALYGQRHFQSAASAGVDASRARGGASKRAVR